MTAASDSGSLERRVSTRLSRASSLFSPSPQIRYFLDFNILIVTSSHSASINAQSMKYFFPCIPPQSRELGLDKLQACIKTTMSVPVLRTSPCRLVPTIYSLLVKMILAAALSSEKTPNQSLYVSILPSLALCSTLEQRSVLPNSFIIPVNDVSSVR